MAKKYSTSEAAAINSKFGEDTKYKVQNGVLKIKQAMTAREKGENPTNKKGYVWGTSVGKEPSGVTAALMSKQRTVKTRAGGSPDTGKKRAVTKSVVPTARKMDTEKYVAKGSRTGTAKPKSSTGRSTVLGTEVYSAKGKRTGTAKPTAYVAKGKRTGTAKPKYIAKGKRTGTAKQLAPTTSVRPIARITTTDPKKEQGYFVDKKKGNAMVRVFPNISPALYGRMSAKERKALNLPSPSSTKYIVDFNQRNALTFIIKK